MGQKMYAEAKRDAFSKLLHKRGRLKLIFEKLWVFLKRDFLTASSYKFGFFLDAVGIIGAMLTFFFIGELFKNTHIPLLDQYGGDYFSFVIIGVAFSSYLGSALSNFGGVIGVEQGMGTMEALIMTPTRISTILIGGSIWNLIFTSLRVTFYLLVGVFLFHMKLKVINLTAIAAILILSLAPFISLGIMSASLILAFKRGDPVSFLFDGASKFLAGAFFPVAILPLWIKKLSAFIPLTYSLRALRDVLLAQGTLRDVWCDLSILLLFSIILFPISLKCFKLALRVAKQQGSFCQF